MYKGKEIKINPEYQRLFRWTREQQSSFIESLILEIPVPPLFFFEGETGIWELLDGLQRISTIIRFLGLELDVPEEMRGTDANESEWHFEKQNDLATPLQLMAGEYLKGMSGLSFSRLPVQLQLNLKRTRLPLVVLKRETHTQYKYEVFKRLNRGGADLEEQELRNCSVRLLGDKFPDFLQRQSANEDFRSALGLRPDKALNGYVEELALRFFTMKNYGDKFTHDVSPLMTTFMEEVARGAVSFDYDAEERHFSTTWKLINAAIPDGDAFRFRSAKGTPTGQFSPTLFELVSLAVASNLTTAAGLDKAALADQLFALATEAKGKDLIGSGSNSKKKTLGRLALAKTWLEKAAAKNGN
jgi:hypothetical protein